MRRKWWQWSLAAIVISAIALYVTASYMLKQNFIATHLTAAMSRALNCDVTLEQLQVEMMPRIRVSGRGLYIRLKDREPNVPPFISVERFTVNLGFFTMIRRTVETVHVDGLKINVPPSSAGDDAHTASTTTDANAAGASDATQGPGRSLFRIGHLVAHDAVLNFVGRQAQDRPLLFAIEDMDVVDPGIERVMNFTASLVNPIPRAHVDVKGTFGPWNRLDPPSTPLGGQFALDHGDLSTIDGIGGMTSANGTVKGRLTDIHAEGTSNTPDFWMEIGGRKVPVTTKFMVTVDGTNGTTRFDRVDAQLINTPVLVTGAITTLPDDKGHELRMSAKIANGRVEDVLQLLIDAPTALITGVATLDSQFHVPPGAGSPKDRLEITGTFGIRGGRFTDPDIQAKMGELSRRGQGKGDDEPMGAITTNFTGKFALKHRAVTLPRLTFEVPGAVVLLAGHYSFESEVLDFLGNVKLAASMSAAVGGFKSVFIKPFNGLFRTDDAGAVLPIHINGTRSNPDFGVRVKDIFKKGKTH